MGIHAYFHCGTISNIGYSERHNKTYTIFIECDCATTQGNLIYLYPSPLSRDQSLPSDIIGLLSGFCRFCDSFGFPDNLLQMQCKAECQGDRSSKAHPNGVALISSAEIDCCGKSKNDGTDNRQPTDRKIEHLVSFHDATGLGFTGLLVGFSFGTLFGWYLASKRPLKMTLALRDRRAKNILIHPVVIAELELSNIQWHVFLADLVESSDNAALKDRPEAFDGLGVNRADNVLPLGVVDNGVRVFLAELVVAFPLIGAEQAYFGRDGFLNERCQSGAFDVLNNASDDIALAADSASNRCFARSPGATALPALVLVTVLGEATNESLVNLNDTNKLLEIFIGQRGANAMHHIPSRAVAAEAHNAVHLASADAFFACQHIVNDVKPIAQRLIRVLEDRAGKVREAIAGRAAGSALRALPMPLAGFEVIDAGIAATRAVDPVRPALGDKVSAASVFVWKHYLELGDGHLNNLWGLFLPSHGFSLGLEGYCHV
jgi:pimeloyl-ACP methyl ester carboxylesterase